MPPSSYRVADRTSVGAVRDSCDCTGRCMPTDNGVFVAADPVRPVRAIVDLVLGADERVIVFRDAGRFDAIPGVPTG